MTNLMTNLLEQGAAWLAKMLAGNAGQTVTYVRGDDETELVAVLGRSPFEQTDEYGVIHEIHARDFLIQVADLVLDGVATLPRAGDRIRATIGGVSGVHEVMAPGGEPPWRYSDAFNRTLRIHTKQSA